MDPVQSSESSDTTTVVADASDVEARNVAVQEWLFTEIAAERKRQDAKWGEQNHADDYWLGIFVEEVGEVAKAVIERDNHDLTVEVIHTMAVLCSWMEARNRRSLRNTAAETCRCGASGAGANLDKPRQHARGREEV